MTGYAGLGQDMVGRSCKSNTAAVWPFRPHVAECK